MEKSNVIRKLNKAAESVLYPLILLLWPLIGADQGITLTDTTYSLGNYLYLKPDTPWFFATFLANRLGSFLMALSGNHHLLTMNVLTGLLVSAAALSCYYVLKVRYSPLTVFAAEFMAIAFCWCPTAILYNYLTYLLLTLGTLFLILAVWRPEKENLFLILAGVCLGMNVLARIANLTQCALIFAFWYVCALQKRSLSETVQKTLYCIGGYAAGFLFPLLILSLPYGVTRYFTMIPGILTMTSSSEGYGLFRMLGDILNAYLSAGKWLALILLYAAAGVVFFALARREKLKAAGRILFALGTVILLRFLWGRGMFTLLYRDYWCMFSWGMLLLILSVIVSMAGLLGFLTGTGKNTIRHTGSEQQTAQPAAAKKETAQYHDARDCAARFECAAALILVLILPLGSNNYTFPVLNCLFVILPVTLNGLRQLFAGLRGGAKKFTENRSAGKEKLIVAAAYPAAVCVILILAVSLFQVSLFHLQFSFRDGTDGAERSCEMRDGIMAGMHTTAENGESLTALQSFLETEKDSNNADGQQRTFLVFGDAPGLFYLLELTPALTTTWPDLDSYPAGWMEEELEQLEEPPVLILHNGGEASGVHASEKLELLMDYADRNRYRTVYDAKGYTVLESR